MKNTDSKCSSTNKDEGHATTPKEIGVDEPFTAEVIARIANMHGIEEKYVETARKTLNVACMLAKQEARRQSIELSAVRTQLKSLKLLVQKLTNELDTISSDTHSLISEAELAIKYSEQLDLNGTLKGEQLTFGIDVLQQLGERSAATSLQISQALTALEPLTELLEVALRTSGEGKRGPRGKRDLEFLFLGAFQVYENFASKKFSLEFLQDGSPISAAASFCVEVAKAYDPSVNTTRIVTESRYARERSIKISNLEEITAYMNNYSKRSR